MTWTVEFLNDEVREEIEALPRDMQTRFTRIVLLITTFGLQHVHEPQRKHISRRYLGNAVVGG